MDLDYDALFTLIDEWTTKMAERAAKLTREKAWGDDPRQWICSISATPLTDEEKRQIKELLGAPEVEKYIQQKLNKEVNLHLESFKLIKDTYPHPHEYIIYSYLSNLAGATKGYLEVEAQHPNFFAGVLAHPIMQKAKPELQLLEFTRYLTPGLIDKLSIFKYGTEAYEQWQAIKKIASYGDEMNGSHA